MMFLDWVAIASALVVSAAAPFMIKPILTKYQVMDLPNSRSSHTTPKLRGVGLAPLLGFVAGVSILLVSWGQMRGVLQLAIVLLASSAIALIGFFEDVRGLRIGVRAGVQFLIGAAGTWALANGANAPLWWVLIGAFFFAAYTNAANFMDGINGISSLQGVAVGLVFAIIGLLLGIQWLALVGFIFAVVFAAFLPWNLSRGNVFLGDVGSYLLGGGIAAIVIAAVLGGVPILAIAGTLVIYLADTGATLAMRVLRGERWQDAHRLHVYQRLVDSGISHVKVAVVVTMATLFASTFGLISLTNTAAGSLTAAGGLAGVVALYLALPHLRARFLSGPAETVQLPDSDLPANVVKHIASRWAVVGASGFIGLALADELRSQGFEVISVPAPRLELTGTATAERVFDQLKVNSDLISSMAAHFNNVDVVVNAAGLAAPDSPADAALFGANALLPSVILNAAERAGVARFIHISSAAVQGRRRRLDETAAVKPFSPYSRSKALGECSLLHYIANSANEQSPEVVILRATSVQGQGRATTENLRRLARSRWASVARPGNQPTVVSSLKGLVKFVSQVGAFPRSLPTIVLQPWEGMTTAGVLESAGGRRPLFLPLIVCRGVVAVGYAAATVSPPLNGIVRRVELMWLGQEQDAAWADSSGFEPKSYVAQLLVALNEEGR